MPSSVKWLWRWEGLLLLVLLLIVTFNSVRTPGYLTAGNWVNMFELSIEKIIVALVMTFIIINAEIDLSVASVMGFAACMVGFLYASGAPMGGALAAGLLVGVLAGLFNSFWISVVGLPSLVVTLAGLIGYRGLAYVLLEDRSIGSQSGEIPMPAREEKTISLVFGADLQPGLYKLRAWLACTKPRDLRTLNAVLLIKAPTDINLRIINGSELLHQGK